MKRFILYASVMIALLAAIDALDRFRHSSSWLEFAINLVVLVLFMVGLIGSIISAHRNEWPWEL